MEETEEQTKTEETEEKTPTLVDEAKAAAEEIRKANAEKDSDGQIYLGFADK